MPGLEILWWAPVSYTHLVVAASTGSGAGVRAYGVYLQDLGLGLSLIHISRQTGSGKSKTVDAFV